MTGKFTQYSMGYYLEGTDITRLLATYREAYKQHFQQQFEDFSAPTLTQLDNSFWHNKEGELIFYAGEVAILDSTRQKADQTLGRNLRNADLAIVSKMLALNISKLPFDSLHVMALMNWNRGHWTSAVLTLKNINKEKYAEIYGEYEAFQKWISAKKEEIKLTLLSEQAPVADTIYIKTYHPGAVFPLSDLSKNDKNLPCIDEVFVEKYKAGNKTKLKYVVLDPKDKTKTIEAVLDIEIDDNAEINLALLQKLKPLILAETSKRGHTSAAKLKYSTVDNLGVNFEDNLNIELKGKLTKEFLEKNKNKILEEVLSPKSLSNIRVFLQYATGYYDEKDFAKKYLGKWIQEFYKGSPKEKSTNNNLKLILAPQDPKKTYLLHFDSLTPCTKNIIDLSKDFLTENALQVIAPSNIKTQSGATCGEHAILNAFRYALLNLTNTVPSENLRTATNYFCVDFAKLFLFDYNHQTYTETYNYILACQQAKVAKLIQNSSTAPVAPQTSPAASAIAIDIPRVAQTQTVNLEQPKTSPGGYVAIGILCGGGIALLSTTVVVPLLGLVSPLSIGIFTSVVLLISASMGGFIADQEETPQSFTFESSNAKPQELTEEERLLQAQSLEASNTNLPVPPKTFIPQATAKAAAGEKPQPQQLPVDLAKANSTKKVEVAKPTA